MLTLKQLKKPEYQTKMSIYICMCVLSSKYINSIFDDSFRRICQCHRYHNKYKI